MSEVTPDKARCTHTPVIMVTRPPLRKRLRFHAQCTICGERSAQKASQKGAMAAWGQSFPEAAA